MVGRKPWVSLKQLAQLLSLLRIGIVVRCNYGTQDACTGPFHRAGKVDSILENLKSVCKRLLDQRHFPGSAGYVIARIVWIFYVQPRLIFLFCEAPHLV